MEQKTRTVDYPSWVWWCLIALKTHLSLLYGVVAGLSGINLLEAPIPSYYNKGNGFHRIAHRTHQCSGNGENGTMCQWCAKGWWTVNDNGSCLMVILIDTAHRDNTSQDDYMFFVPCRMFHPPLHYYMYYREIFPKINLYSANTTITVLHH